MLQITLGTFRAVPESDDPNLPRTFAGWRDCMSDQDVLTAARGWWVLNRSRAEHERYAIIGARGLGRLAVEIIETSWATRADGRARVQRQHPAAWAPHPRPLRRPTRASRARKPSPLHQRRCSLILPMAGPARQRRGLASAEAGAAWRSLAVGSAGSPFLQVAAVRGTDLDVVLRPADGRTAVEVRAPGAVQHQVRRLGSALAVDEVAVLVIIEPAEEAAVIIAEHGDGLLPVTGH